MDDFLTTKEAMSLLKVKSRNTIKKKINQGLASYGVGKSKRFKYSDIIDFMEYEKEKLNENN